MGACFGADERFGSGDQDPNQRRFEQVIARVQVSEEPIALAKGISPGNLHTSGFTGEELSCDLLLSCPINSHPNRSPSMRT
jgi:hypothetical protein